MLALPPWQVKLVWLSFATVASQRPCHACGLSCEHIKETMITTMYILPKWLTSLKWPSKWKERLYHWRVRCLACVKLPLRKDAAGSFGLNAQEVQRRLQAQLAAVWPGQLREVFQFGQKTI